MNELEDESYYSDEKSSRQSQFKPSPEGNSIFEYLPDQNRTFILEVDEEEDYDLKMAFYPETRWVNVAVLALVFIIALVANLSALPVILFRRTKFGNGLFAVLILCLNFSDLAVIFFSVLGSLVVEASHFMWGGAPGSCKVKEQKLKY